MDLQSALVCVLVFVVSAALLLLISMFGMREKSYEEALAEQRQLTSGLLGTGQRSKPKEKKQKKSGKKVKEKPVSAENSNEVIEECESTKAADPSGGSTSGGSSSPLKHHVEFEEPAAVVADSAAQAPNTKKRNKKDKVKPILLNKEKTPVSDVDSSKIPVANHFDVIHPKDDFELLHSHQKEDIPVKQEKPETEVKVSKTKSKQIEKETGEQQKPSKTGHKDKKQSQPQQTAVVEDEQTPVAEQPIVAKSAPAVQSTVNNNNAVISVKEKKKKKSEFNTLQQMTASDKHDVNVSLLVPLVRKADLSRSEIQILIDLLLNKQHEAPAVIDEWSEGRADPVQKLKRQLAEKERALTEEQEALASAQAKLREVRAELNSERSRLLQNYRNLEETLHAKHTELQAAAARMHTQNQKLQNMQAQINEEVMTSHKLREELNAMQLQRQQLDIHLNQKQETEASFQSQLSQLRNEYQETQNVNSQLNMELRSVRESSHAEKEMLHERIRQIESQAVHFKNESDQRQELARQLEESRRAYSEMEHRFHITESELAVRYQQQLDEAIRMEQTKSHDDVARLQAEVSRLTHMQKQQQDEQRRIVTDLQSQVSSLQTENSKLEAENGAVSEDRNKEIEILNLQNELASLRVRLQQRETEFSVEIEEVKNTVRDSEAELKSQREKNDELRKKNWKMMEALNSAEASLRTKQKKTVTVENNEANLMKLKLEEEKVRNFLHRLFPDVKLSNSDNWMLDAECAIEKYINDLHIEKEEINVDSSVDVARLQAQVVHYRNIIEDTEGMLNKLQSHVEREETTWRKQIQAKDEEIEALKEQNRTQQRSTPHHLLSGGNASPDDHGVKFAFSCIERSLPLITEELQSKISELEETLLSEQQAKQELKTECESLRERINSLATVKHAKHTQIDNGGNFNGIEQVVEEKNRLAELLSNEQKRCQELTDEILRLKSTEISVPTKVPQNHTSNGTSLESVELPNSASSSSVSPTTTKPRKNKKKKAAISN